MDNISGASNYLNNQQLMTISDNIVGVSKTSNVSLFNDVKRLDENKNEEIERPESGIAKLVSLGNRVLNKLATLLGIELNKPTNNQPMESFEDAQNEQIIDKYFKPLSDKAMSSSSLEIEEGALDNLVSKEQIQYTYASIIAEKEAMGIKITDTKEDDYKKTILFEDGSELVLSNDNSRVDYTAIASDGSRATADIRSWNTKDDISTLNEFSVRHMVDDGNGPSNELLKSLRKGEELLPDGRVKRIMQDGAEEIINTHSNAEIYSTNVSYQRTIYEPQGLKDDALVLAYDKQHTIENKGEATTEVEGMTLRFNKSKHKYIEDK